MDAVSVQDIQLTMREVQDHIANWLVDAIGGKKYREDVWQYSKGTGGGRSRLWEGGPEDVLEKAGVNFSMIEGTQLPMYVLRGVEANDTILLSPRLRLTCPSA